MEEREVKVAQKSKLLQRPGDAKQKYRIDNENLYTRRSNKKYYTHISISFNQHNSLAVHLASQSIQGEKEPQEIQKEKNSMEKEKKGKQKGMVILHTPLFSFSFFSSTSPCTGPRERDQIARPAGDGSNGRAAGRPRAKTRAVEMAAA